MSQAANQLLETLLSRKDIGENSAYNLMTELAEGVVAPPLAGALLTALRLKGESAEEVRGFARAMRDVAFPSLWIQSSQLLTLLARVETVPTASIYQPGRRFSLPQLG